MAKFTYPHHGRFDDEAIRVKEQALEGFLNSLDLSFGPDDPGHNHDVYYAPIGHTHGFTPHDHPGYVEVTEGATAPPGPTIGDIWVENPLGTVEEVWIWTSDGWIPLMGGGGGGPSGPHSRHPDSLIIFESITDLDKWQMAYNPTLESLDFLWVG